ncbi:MAG TPA: sugar ABC transporter ATP-binding protein [Aggregatilineales bacterium]|nr:sugar ABC transporter ATP-binding protein [Aggregatilineales bacterium]
MPADHSFLRMEHISKSFPGVKALDDVTFEVGRGEIHALVGENGAGKSTLMKILTGALRPDEGRILLRGEPVRIDNPSDAQALGISIIYQELSLIPYLTVGQNIFLGREPRGFLPGFIDWRELYGRAQALLDQFGLDIDARTEVRFLSIAEQQMAEVAKALSLNADLIAMDEPTSSLTERETEVLFDLMRSLRDEGVSIIFISHRLSEIFEVCDRITVLRDGKLIGTAPTAELTEDEVVSMMVGREIDEMFPRTATERGRVVLEVSGLSDGDELQSVSFKLHSGEILGVAGLVGAGRTALAETLFGIRHPVAGEVRIEGERVTINSPQKAIELGMGFVPEDRKQQGLFLNMAVRENIVISDLDEVASWGFLKFREVERLAQDYVNRLDVRTPSLRQRVRNLSGGNQQKVVIARWLTLKPRVLILDEPTRGIDVGTKAEIYHLLNQLARQGVAVLVISSELPEVLGISDRILVMHEGRITATLNRDEATQDAIMRAATGGKINHVVE